MSNFPYRIGQGFDVHQLVPERPLIIGGIKIDYHLGLKGHSDADVLLHAICDSILGALALGDIGKWFPDNDPRYSGIDSKLLLKDILNSPELKGWALVNLDCTIIAQQPKFSPYIGSIRESIAELFWVKEDRISVKATTTEKLGFTGRGEGIAAQAIIMLHKD